MHDPPMFGVSHAYSENCDRIGGSRPMGVLGRRSDRGVVASAVYEADTRGHPTFVTLMSPDQPGANRTLTAVIYGTDRAKFGGTPEAAMQGQRLCVTGFVSFFRQRPEMILSDPMQVSYPAPQSIAQVR